MSGLKWAIRHNILTHSVKLEKPDKAILMDLDGTSIKSEEFWIYIIQLTVANLIGNHGFELEEAETPHISGHSISEHLKYCINKYFPHKTVEEVRKIISYMNKMSNT